MSPKKKSRSKRQDSPVVQLINDFITKEEVFLTEEKTLRAAWTIIQHTVPSEPEDDEIQAQGGTTIRECAFSMLKQNVKVMHTYAKTPIEKNFLGSLLIHCMARNPFSLQYTIPVKGNPEEYFTVLRAEHEDAMKIWHLYQKDYGTEDIHDFLNFVVTCGRFSRDNQIILQMHVLLWHALGMKNAYFVTLQQYCPHLKLEGSQRGICPDLFVWIPAHPEYKVVVECDGFEWHGTSEAFTRDKKRDRLLQDNGYIPYHFSGKEINENPFRAGANFQSTLNRFQEKLDKRVQQDP